MTFTLECSGNTGLPFFIGGVGQRPLGRHAAGAAAASGPGSQDPDAEVVFWGADAGDGDDPRQLGRASRSPGRPRSLTITEQFARSMSVDDAMDERQPALLRDERRPRCRPSTAFPLRLIAPGWYGVANVKWLTRIEVMDQRFAGRFMARDYVTIREPHRGQTVWTFNTVSHDRLKSAPAKVTRRRDRYAVMGAAWGAPIAEVEVQIDEGPWRAAELDRRRPRARARRLRVAVLDLPLGHARPVSTRSARVPSTSTATASPRRRTLPRQQGHVLGEQRADHPAGAHPRT